MRLHFVTPLGAIFLAPVLLAQTPSRVSSLGDLSAAFETLAARVRPAVVQIFSTGYVTADDDQGSNTASLISPQRSTGSGVILSADGFIITNNHVVAGAQRIEVSLYSTSSRQASGSRLTAHLIGADRDTDLAVIKIDKTDLPFLSLGDSQLLKQGELVMAFGNPLGLEGSASMGIVSSSARRLHADDPRVYIQTDAPINPGNSGGPLVNAAGDVIGLNTLILTQSGGSEGLGFAIPSNVVRSVYDQIRKEGHVHRGQIGLIVQTITPEMAQALKLPQDWGVIAADVSPGGPADKAGVKVQDIIVSVGGRVMDDAPQLETAIYRLKLSDVVELSVLRAGKKLDFNIPVIERDDDPQRFADMVNPNDNLVSRLGILGIEINDKLSQMLPDLRHEYGIVVAARSANPPYSGPALQPGDVIYEVNGAPVTSIKALRAELDTLKSGDPAALQIERNGKLVYVVVEME